MIDFSKVGMVGDRLPGQLKFKRASQLRLGENMRKRTNTARLGIVSVLLLLFTSCWIPENFDTKITINKDGSYTFTYDGTLTFGPALAAAQQGGLSAKDEAEFQKEGETLRREPGFKKVDYQGKGRYKVLFEKAGNRGGRFYFVSQELKFFAVLPQADRTITVTAVRPSREEMQQLNSIGAKIEGTLSVSVANGVEVVRHNAESEPAFFGLIGAYKWQIKSPNADPVIVVKPPS